MKRLTYIAAILALTQGLTYGVTPTKRLSLDIGRPENTFVLGPISRGSTEYIDAALYVRGTAYAGTDLDGYIFYSVSNTSTSGVYIYNTSAATIAGHLSDTSIPFLNIKTNQTGWVIDKAILLLDWGATSNGFDKITSP